MSSRNNWKFVSKCTLAVGATLVAAGTAKAEESGSLLHGFADAGVNYATANSPERLRGRGFYSGALDLYISPELGNVRFLTEVNFDPGLSDGAVGVDLERLQLGYTFGSSLTTWVGRFHTPIGYWNTAYHHGAQLQTSVYKPKFIDFEDKYGVLPVHTVGFMASGGVSVGEGRLNYDLWAGNGSRMVGDGESVGAPFNNVEMNITRDDNTSLAYGGRLGFAFGGGLQGLQIGVSGLSEKVNAYDVLLTLDGTKLNESMQLNMLGAHLVYDANNVEFLSEGYYFSDSNLDAAVTAANTSMAGYAQLAYTINETWQPYVRGEMANFNQDDHYFAYQSQGGSYTREAVGLRYNLNEKSAVKAEVLNTDITDKNPGVDGGQYQEVRMQYAIRF